MGHGIRDVALLPLRSRAGVGSVDRQLTDRQVVAVAAHHLRRHIANKIRGSIRDDRIHESFTATVLRNVDFVKVVEGGIDGGEVLIDNRLSLRFVGLLDGLLDLAYRLLAGQDAGQRKKAGLHHRGNALAHAGFPGNTRRVDYVQSDAASGDGVLHLTR